MKTLTDFIGNCQIPLINAIFYPNGDILVLDSHYVGEKYALQVLCKSSIGSFFSYHDLDEVSSFDICYKAEYDGYCVMCGEGSFVADGIIYAKDTVEDKLLWAIFLDNSNPFYKVDFTDDNVLAYSTKEFKLIIPIKSLERLAIKNNYDSFKTNRK